MPRLWVQTIEGHRREVREAILVTSAALITEHGLAAVTMSQIAEQTGIGRATLYKYFPDVEAILDAWHEEHVARHLEYLVTVRDRERDPGDRLAAVARAYALVSYERAHPHAHSTADEHQRHVGARRPAHHHGQAHGQHHADIAALVHRTAHFATVERRLTRFISDLLRAAMKSGDVRDDVSTDELANYCLHALNGASALRTRAEVQRLADVTLSGLRTRKARV